MEYVTTEMKFVKDTIAYRKRWLKLFDDRVIPHDKYSDYVRGAFVDDLNYQTQRLEKLKRVRNAK